MQIKLPSPHNTECAVCSRELAMIVIKGRPRFFTRGAAGADRNITCCPGCGARLDGLSVDQVLAQSVRVP